MPEYPHFTRPAEYRGWGVPDVLLSGDHGKVREWRLEQSRERAAEHERLQRGERAAGRDDDGEPG